MGSYVLILTMAIKIGYSGMGGLATQEFDTLSECSAAAQQWKNTILQQVPHVTPKELSAICVKK